METILPEKTLIYETNIHDYLDQIGAEPPPIDSEKLKEAYDSMIKVNSIEEAVEEIVKLDEKKPATDWLGKVL